MGDVAMCVPVLHRFLKQYPEVKITVLTKPFFAPIFEATENVTVITAEVKKKHKGLFGLWKLARELKNSDLKLDAVADLHNVLRTKILRFFFFLYGIKCAKLDKGRSEKKVLTKLEKKEIHPLKSTHQRYAEVFATLGFPIDLKKQVNLPTYSVPQEINKKIGHAPKKWVGIAPFAAHQPKMYPIDLMEQVIAELDREDKIQLFLFGGGKEEKALLNNLASKYKNAFSIAGKIAFSQELKLVSKLDVMLSMDSGNGHLAAMFGVPVITLWGATHPFAGFAPFQQPYKNQLLPDLKRYPLLPTSIYGKKEIPGYENVMRDISPAQVNEALKKLLG